MTLRMEGSGRPLVDRKSRRDKLSKRNSLPEGQEAITNFYSQVFTLPRPSMTECPLSPVDSSDHLPVPEKRRSFSQDVADEVAAKLASEI